MSRQEDASSVLLELAAIPTVWDYLADIVDPTSTGWTPGWVPHPKQALAADLSYQADYTLFGGSAGPGKSELMCEIAIREMRQYPNNYGLILRRSLKALQRSVILRLKQKLLPHNLATWHAQDKLFTFPNGSILECKSSQYADDIHEFSGAELGFVGVEEAAEMFESQIEFITGRMRPPSGTEGITPRMFLTANPHGPGYEWVKRWFVRPTDEMVDSQSPNEPEPYMHWWFARSEQQLLEMPDLPPQVRVFVPALPTDNPNLTPAYLQKLYSIADPRMRAALLYGDWDAMDQLEGALWSYADTDEGCVNPVWYKQHIDSWNRVIAIDPSGWGPKQGGVVRGDAYGYAISSLGADATSYVDMVGEVGKLPQIETLTLLIRLYHDYQCSTMVVESNHGGELLMALIRQLDPSVNVQIVHASDGKRVRAEPVAALFQKEPSTGKRRVRLVGNNEKLMKKMSTTLWTPGEPSPNDLDAMVYAVTWHMLRGSNTTSDMSSSFVDTRAQGRR